MPNKDGLLHISQISHERVNAVTDVLSVGDKIKVKVTEIDRRNKSLLLSNGEKKSYSKLIIATGSKLKKIITNFAMGF